MLAAPSFTSLAFALGPYRLSCALEGGLLALRVSTSETHIHRPALASLISKEDELQLVISCIRTVNEIHPPNAHSRIEDQSLMRRVNDLQSYVAELQRKLESQSRSRKELPLSDPSQRRGSRSLLRQGSAGCIRERGEQTLSGIARRSGEQNIKMEMLNDMLQEKLMKRDGNLLGLERTILEREELIRELAEKLIVANLEKEDIFNEYEKILQTTVFHQEDESNVPQEETPIQSPVQPAQQTAGQGGERDVVKEVASVVVLPVGIEEEIIE